MTRQLLFLFLVATLSVSGQKNIYESSRFDELSNDHEVLAILPFLTNLDLKDNVQEE